MIFEDLSLANTTGMMFDKPSSTHQRSLVLLSLCSRGRRSGDCLDACWEPPERSNVEAAGGGPPTASVAAHRPVFLSDPSDYCYIPAGVNLIAP